MNRLDRHINTVRSKLAVEQFLFALGYAVVGFFAIVLICIVVDRLFWVRLPALSIWFWAGISVAVLAAAGFAFLRRPSAHQAAVFIDEKLGLNEKFSTALYARAMSGAADPFAAAAIKDAERTADNVSLHRRFPIGFPTSAYYATAAAILVLLISFFVPRVDLFGHQAKLALAARTRAEHEAAQAAAQAVMTKIQAMPSAMQGQQKIELAKKEIQHVLDQPNVDPVIMKDTAMKAEEEAEAARQEEIKNNQAFAQAQADKAVFNSLNPSMDDKGPVANASRDIANADFAKAVDELQSLPEKFNSMTPEQQQKATQQMKAVAQQLQKIASDPAALQHLQQQLQQQGVTPQQMQQIAKAAQQAAQGNPQAQQQLQQMQKQLTRQMNGGKGPTPQQQQAIQKAMQQMQSVASSQAKAQQLTSAAQQMAQGMQAAQAPRQGGNKAGQQQASAKSASQQQAGSKQGGQQSSGQQSASGQQQGAQQSNQPGQQPGQQPGGQQGAQAAGQQPGQQAAGQQPGGQQPGQGSGQGQQQMQQAGQQMAQALGEMDAVQKDQEQQEIAKNSGDQPDPNQNGNEGQGNNPGNQPGKGAGGQGPGKMGHPGKNPGNGMGGPGIGQGGIAQRESAPFSVKQELDPSQNIAGGKILAKSFVKADQLVGKSTIELSPAERAAVKESTDDVSEESVPKDAQKVVKEYFDTVGNGQ
jgi:hypothetical protein